MKTKHYFVQIGYNTAATNKLHKETLKMIGPFHLKTCSDVTSFKIHLSKKIDGLNKQNSRCTPLLVSGCNGDIMIHSRNLDSWYVMIYLRKIKGEINIEHHEN